MPYLQVELDAIDAFGEVALASGLSEGDVSIGLLRLWRYCWKNKVTHVARERLATFFRCEVDRIAQALKACEFIDTPSGRPDYHVRGAEKRLRVFEAQSEAGKKAAANLKQNVGKTTGSSRDGAGGEPEVSPGSGPALTSSIQHPASSSTTLRAKKPPAQPDPRHAPLRDGLEKIYVELVREPWKFDGSDAKALSQLLKSSEPPEIIARWRKGLTDPYRQIRRVRELLSKWGHFGNAPPAQAGGARFTRAQDVDKTSFAKTGTADGF